jgi:general secretion pathway protein C
MLASLARKLSDDQSRLHAVLGRAAVAVTVVMLVVLADRLAALTWSLVPRPTIPIPELPSGAGSDGVAGEQAVRDHAQLAGLHLFGQVRVATAKPAPKPVPETMPETRLKLTLRGVFHSADDDLARVIVAGPDGREEVYSLGGRLPGGATLEEIGAQRVVLDRDGRRETLTFPIDKRAGAAIRAAPGPSEAAPAPVAATATRINATSLAEQYRQAMDTDPAALTDIAQVQPFIDQGTFRGFRLRPGRKPALLRQLGLRPGDVVTSIAGTRLDNMSRAMEALRSFADADQVDVTILRNGREIPYSYRLN